MKVLTIAVILFIVVLLESTLFPYISFMGIKPEPMLALIVSFAFLDDREIALLIGVVGGLLHDIIFGQVIGGEVLLYVILFLGVDVLRHKIAMDRIVMPVITMFDVSVIYNTIMGLTFKLLGLEVNLRAFLQLLVFGGVYTAVVGVLIYNVLYWLYGKYKFMNKKSIFSKVSDE